MWWNSREASLHISRSIQSLKNQRKNLFEVKLLKIVKFVLIFTKMYFVCISIFRKSNQNIQCMNAISLIIVRSISDLHQWMTWFSIDFSSFTSSQTRRKKLVAITKNGNIKACQCFFSQCLCNGAQWNSPSVSPFLSHIFFYGKQEVKSHTKRKKRSESSSFC